MKLPRSTSPANTKPIFMSSGRRAGCLRPTPTALKNISLSACRRPTKPARCTSAARLFVTSQDIMARHARQQGKDVLWLPGTDHAALATNTMMEKQLAEQGTNKHEIGREDFMQRSQGVCRQQPGYNPRPDAGHGRQLRLDPAALHLGRCSEPLRQRNLRQNV